MDPDRRRRYQRRLETSIGVEHSPTSATGTGWERAPLLHALEVSYQEHRRCGELDGGVEGDRVWMTCDCGARIASRVEEHVAAT
jgi:hypothetical protein